MLPPADFSSPATQMIIVTVCLAINPGLYASLLVGRISHAYRHSLTKFNKLLGAGGGEPSSLRMSNISNGILYAVNAACSIPVGTLLNKIGPKWTLLIGIPGYPLYQGSLWYFEAFGDIWFPIFAGAILGFSASCCWTTSIYMVNAYAEEQHKAKWRAIQWSSTLLGALVGSILALALSSSSAANSVPGVVYLTFLVMQTLSMVLVFWTILPTKHVKRRDGTFLAKLPPLSTRNAFLTSRSIWKNWHVVVLTPCMMVPEMYQSLHVSLNASFFNLRWRAINGMLNAVVQISASLTLALLILDNTRLMRRRSRRVWAGVAANACLIIPAYILQTIWIHELGPGAHTLSRSDERSFDVGVVAYLLQSTHFATLQNILIYILGTFTNAPRATAALSACYNFCEQIQRAPTIACRLIERQVSVLEAQSVLESMPMVSPLARRTLVTSV